MRKFLLTILALLLIVAIALVALYLLRDIIFQPSIILTSKQCAPPCWDGIQPGESTFAQVLNALRQTKGVNEQSLNTTPVLSTKEIRQIIWLFQAPVPDISGTVYFENETVTAISILTVNSLRVGEAFARLGEPSLVWPEVDPSSYGQTAELSLISPEKGFLVEVHLDIKKETNTVDIKENSRVYRVVYFDPAKYQDLLNTRILIRRPPLTRQNSPQPWTGFGAVQVGGD
jgi:hypothetical protein